MSNANYVWSYSSIGLYTQCPHKYYRLKVAKDIKEPKSEAMLYGEQVHKAAELYIANNTPVPESFTFMQPALDKLKEKDGEKFCELKMGLTRALHACKFFDPSVWYRGIADLVIVNENKAWVVDYKTAKTSKYADLKQLELMALSVFKHFPKVEKVKSGALFVVANDFVKEDYSRHDEDMMWRRWFDETHRLEQAYKLNVWNPKPNFTCRKHCPVTDCVHNGRNTHGGYNG